MGRRYGIILAGGSGSRLWPASLSTMPKQFIPFLGKSFFDHALSRALYLGLEKIVIVSEEIYKEAILHRLWSFPLETRQKFVLFLEPDRRNTTAAISLAVGYLYQEDPEASILVMPSDHLIELDAAFLNAVDSAFIHADKHIIIFGVQPTQASEAYGYIQCGQPITQGSAFFEVKAFKEKPHRDEAERYVSSQDYLWNSGLYLFHAELFQRELIHLNPDVDYQSLFLYFQKGIEINQKQGVIFIGSDILLRELYEKLPSIPVDKALSEKTRNLLVLKSSFFWSDMGTWDVISQYPLLHQHIEVESKNNYIFSDIPVALCGVEDLIVVVQNGAVLVCRKGYSELVKNVSAQAQKGNRFPY